MLKSKLAAPLFFVVNPRRVATCPSIPTIYLPERATCVELQSPCRALPLKAAFEHNPCHVFDGKSEPMLIVDLRLSNHSGHGKSMSYSE